MNLYELIVFGILSIPLVYFSKHVIFNIKSHGFYRFLGWECIAWLLVGNYKFWFQEIFSPNQIISWIFLIYSLYLIIIGVDLIKKMGKSRETRKDGTLYQFEKTTELIESGLYRYIRHPLYGSLIFLTWGVFFKHVTIPLLVITVLATVLFFITSKIEEKENTAYFGEKYLQYIKRSKMFVPFII